MKILHLVSSSRGAQSFSHKLGNAIVEKLQAAHAGAEVITHNLVTTQFPHMEEVHITSFFTPAEERSAALLEAVKHSEAAVAALKSADAIVIDVPMYNFTIPSTLKSWIDHICRAGQTFSYTADGPVGLVTGKKVYLAISSGGVYSDGPMKGFDFTEPYLRAVLGFLGMTDITTYRVEGVSMPGGAETALPKAVAAIAI